MDVNPGRGESARTAGALGDPVMVQARTWQHSCHQGRHPKAAGWQIAFHNPRPPCVEGPTQRVMQR